MGFVNEQVNALNTTLYRAFSESIKERPRRSSLSDMNEAVRAGDRRKFLSLASEAIDLSGASLPTREKLSKYLKMYRELPKKNEDEKALELLLAAKCTFALHGIVQENLLNSTIPLSQSIGYWSGVHGNWYHEAFYGVQTMPIRIYHLAGKTLRDSPMGISGISQQISQLTRKDVFKQLFPHYTRIASTRHIIRSEVAFKRSRLTAFRKQQAARLGLLMQRKPEIDPKSDLDAAYHQIDASLNLLVHVLQQILESNVASDCFRDPAMDNLLTTEFAKSKDLDTLFNTLDEVTEKMLPGCQQQYTKILQLYGRPSWITRYWTPLIVLYFGGNAALKYAFRQKDNIKIWVNEARETAQDFVVHWLWEPMLKVWDTIRMKDQQLALLSKEGLRSDMESLERMVAQFGRDHYNLSDDQLAQLTSQVREGDLSSVLKAYEEAIKSPVKNAIRGDLIRTLLIQVQKTKVDVDLAMAALDKLLKSNELNFAFLAVAPSMILMWALGAWVKTTWDKRTGVRVGKLGGPMRDALSIFKIRREVERILNQADNRDNDLPAGLSALKLSCEQQGLVLCEVHLLRSYARRLPQRNFTREKFIEDLRELENPKYNLEQRMRTIQRMTRTWGFLTAPQRLNHGIMSALNNLFNLKHQLVLYGAHHNNPVNVIIHIIFVPTIFWTGKCKTVGYFSRGHWVLTHGQQPFCFTSFAALVFAANTGPLIDVSTLPASLHWLTNFGPDLGFFAVVFYSLLYAPILYGMSYYATQFLHDNANANNIAIWLHVAAWIFQFLGHGLAEKRSPKLVDNLVQGYKPKLHREMMIEVDKDIAAFKAQKAAQQKAKSS
ncbi:hypothetical protein INT43_008417 [Umbelopsis isabellina]|uniref:Uncharacterized protein n=1 Tax=Mortierella isabellina TaxID=91625 RepID=A0A8H7PVY5_MORIS|nr:hypothetical protein INT43_008417 [Umbelopsis isabellina]